MQFNLRLQKQILLPMNYDISSLWIVKFFNFIALAKTRVEKYRNPLVAGESINKPQDHFFGVAIIKFYWLYNNVRLYLKVLNVA